MDISESLPVEYNVDQLKDILEHFINYNINITPSALLLLEKINLTDSHLEKFIQHFSFNTKENNLITVDVIRNEFSWIFTAENAKYSSIYEIPESQTALREKGYGNECDCETKENSLNLVLKPELIEKASQSSTISDNSSIPPIESLKKSPVVSSIDLKSEDIKTVPILQSIVSARKISIDEDLKKEMASLNRSSSEPSDSASVPPQSTLSKSSIPPKIILKPKKSKYDEDGELIEEEDEESVSPEETSQLIDLFPPVDASTPEEEAEIARIREEKQKHWDALQLRMSTSMFHPLAAEYSPDYKVIKEPTGKLYTDGKIDEFLAVQVDKFNKLKQILLKRPEATQVQEIKPFLQNNRSCNVKFIGMVVEKRLTGNKNYMIKFEDPTGTVTALVRSNDQHPEVYSLMDKLLPDHVVLVDGFFNVDVQKKSHIVLVSDIVFPDTKKSHDPTFPNEDLSVALISDTHFGSSDWVEKVWHRFVDLLNCRIGDDRQIEQAGKVKYLCIAGDLVDGIGIYPNQENRLAISDIYAQYEAVAHYFEEIPDYITVVVSPGDHDAVRKALPGPAIPKEFAPKLYDMGVKMVGSPAYVSLHDIVVLMFHGTSLIDMNMSIPGLKNEDPPATMKELIRARHLVPSYGKKTELAPCDSDWLTMDIVPDILHTGHLHKNGFGWYNGILMVNSGCFQNQTDYMRSFGITPDIGKPTMVNLKGPKLHPYVIDLMD